MPPGRPPFKAGQRRNAVVPVRFTEDERDIIEAAAEADGQAVSAWVRDRALAAARRRSRGRPEAD
ncbi:plasmid mobilization protein (plasmid) [Mycobacterium sp. smrl_JER01]|uniref:plasmid mobilization protein n=1 Tax=Mycobacterium sp. smrl_JER01 TaxID=3402633 RepID=UPI003AC4B9E6